MYMQERDIDMQTCEEAFPAALRRVVRRCLLVLSFGVVFWCCLLVLSSGVRGVVRRVELYSAVRLCVAFTSD